MTIQININKILVYSIILAITIFFVINPTWAEASHCPNWNHSPAEAGQPCSNAPNSSPSACTTQSQPLLGGLVPCTGNGCGTCEVVALAQNITTFIIGISTAIAVIVFVWAGFLILSAGGNATQAKRGRGVMTDAVIGLIIILSAWLIIDIFLKTLLPSGTVAFSTGSMPWNQVVCSTQATVCDNPNPMSPGGSGWQSSSGSGSGSGGTSGGGTGGGTGTGSGGTSGGGSGSGSGSGGTSGGGSLSGTIYNVNCNSAVGCSGGLCSPGDMEVGTVMRINQTTGQPQWFQQCQVP